MKFGEAVNKRPKIIFLVTEDWYFCSHRKSLARAAREKGYDVVVATRVQKHGVRIQEEGFKLIPIRMRRRSKNFFSEIKTTYELFLIYFKEKPDLVHQVAMKPVVYGSIAAKLAGVKAIVNAMAGLGYIFIAKGIRGTGLRLFMSSLFRLAFSHRACRVIFQNPEDQQLFIDQKIITKEKAVVIRGSGVNVHLFSPTPPVAGDPVVIFTSRMLWDKGVNELVEAARLLKLRKVKCQVVLVGKPDPDNPASIPLETLNGWNREGVITWLGYREDVPELLRQSHVAVLPSYREGLPKSLLEAAAVGLPLVATDVPGCREVVRHGVNGFLVPPRDPDKLVEALTKLLEDKYLRMKMGKASREIAMSEFSEELVIRETLKLYDSLLCKD